VQRNRVKRLLREAFWSLGDAVPAIHDYVIVARQGSAELAESAGTTGFAEDLERLLGELGEAGDGPALAR
jgi:ribonuclease P protein component